MIFVNHAIHLAKDADFLKNYAINVIIQMNFIKDLIINKILSNLMN